MHGNNEYYGSTYIFYVLRLNGSFGIENKTSTTSNRLLWQHAAYECVFFYGDGFYATPESSDRPCHDY